ncbi:MAG: hypothetical protein HGA67_00630 [Candidatus Yonathbacteria bacterium]|nr:hypothetical protein [Candidatus Yonathbacteria bacterium]
MSLFLGGVVALVSGLVVFLNNSKDPVNISWVCLSIAAAVWSFGYLLMMKAVNSGDAMLYNEILHIGASIIPVAYLFFVFNLTRTIEIYKKIFYIAVPLMLAFAMLSFSPLMLNGVIQRSGSGWSFSFAPLAGPWYLLFTVYFFLTTLIGASILGFVIKKRGLQHKDRVRFIFVLVSSTVGFIGGGSVFPLTFGILVPPYPILLFSLYPIIITYAIVKHQLFDMKVVTAESTTIVLWLLLLMRTFLSNTPEDQVLNGAVFVIAFFIGAYLIKSVREEVKIREEIEALVTRLRIANEHLRELDRQKTEFVSIASHQLRTPLTAIKGYASMVLEGSFGEVCNELQEPIERIFRSSVRLADTVEDFLNVTRIEQGRMQYEESPVDMDALTREIVDELGFTAKEKNISLTVSCDEGNHIILGDWGKMRQVILNLIDNAIKYTPEGGVTAKVSSRKQGRRTMVTVEITDTGIGIPFDFMDDMFGKFNRGENSGMYHANGSGIGLYVANEIVKAHRGAIEVRTKEGKGTTFAVVLPAESHSSKREKMRQVPHA